MTTLAPPAPLTLRPVEEFAGLWDVWPRGDRVAALRAAGQRFRERFKREAQVLAAHTADYAAAPYETKLAFAGATHTVIPYVYLMARVLIVDYVDFDGRPRRLAWEPVVVDGSRATPYYAKLARRYGAIVADHAAPVYHEPQEALDVLGVANGSVDVVAHDHLHVQDLRTLMGTSTSPPMFPNAVFLAQRKEVDTFRSVHPMQHAWYVPGGMDDVPAERLVLVDGDVQLGPGIAILTTPGHTDGNQSLVLNTPQGVYVSSENGVAADSWQPELSRIPGLRRYSEFYEREVVMNSNTLEDSIDQYDSMIKEKAVADRNPRDPRWLNILPSAELAPLRRCWPARPTFFHGGLHFGELRR